VFRGDVREFGMEGSWMRGSNYHGCGCDEILSGGVVLMSCIGIEEWCR